ncbi:MAG: nuclear transport factor 2 family protein [Chloroflexi bacterium]|nr:MAG: nuclear transport factor 2 family protein [Chloroflexota bacterium]RLC95977.1 MAG: nuclear transport factor 2 family protein [Chloroflexota bacterium]
MARPEELEARLRRLEDIEAIKRLKYRYFRTLDCKLWDELAECFTPDATTDYSEGQYHFQGIYAIMKFLQRAMARYDFFGMHQGHHPEIELTGEGMARGTWAAHNYMIDTRQDRAMLMAAFYHDEYVRVDGEWKIRHTGYQRVFEESWDRQETPGLELTANMFATSAESA